MAAADAVEANSLKGVRELGTKELVGYGTGKKD